MQWDLEQALPQEIEGWRRNVFWYEFRTLRQARIDRENGLVEVCRTEVTQAWTLNSCLGAPCCPNEWLLECTVGSFLYFCSWDFLDQWDQINWKDLYFPGSHLTVRRWPITKRVVFAQCTGDRMAFTPWLRERDQLVKAALKSIRQVGYERCHEIPRHLLRGLKFGETK